MKRLRCVALVTIYVLSTGCVTVQQAPEPVKEEILVRVWTSTCEPQTGCVPSSRRRQGALIAMDSSSLTLLAWREPDPAVTLSIRSVDRIDLYRGKVPSAKAAARRGFVGALVGAAGGAALGAVLGGLVGDPGRGAAEGAALGGTAGLVGGVYAGIFEGDDHWEAVPVMSLYTLYCLTNEKADCKSGEEVLVASHTS